MLAMIRVLFLSHAVVEWFPMFNSEHDLFEIVHIEI